MKRYLTISACLVVLVVAFGCRQKPSGETEKEGPEPNVPAQIDTKVVEPKQEAKAVVDGIAVTVNGRDITENQLEAEIEKMALQMQPGFLEKNRDKVRQQILDRMIIWKLLEEKIEEAKIVATEEDVIEQIKEIAAQQKLSMDEFKAMLQARGLKFDEWKQKMQFEMRIKFQKLVEAKMGDQINVTETDANNFYSANIQQFQVPEQVRASHILVQPDTTDPNTDPNEAKAKALVKAQDLLKQIKEGADFAELAKATGGYPSAPRGGDLGFRSRGGGWDAVFEKAAFGLKIGQTSDVVETQFGYHIIMVTDRKEASVTTFEQAKGDIIKMLKQEKQRPLIAKYIESLKAQAKIVYPLGKEPPLLPTIP
ncbi:MAG: peptidylprolyl isomerase [Planctomycetota bacterium]|jgi:peptidyl-prolyl cis-trans isomerase C